MTAFGMPAERFEAIAQAAQLLTRSRQPIAAPGMLLREARAMKAPCIG